MNHRKIFALATAFLALSTLVTLPAAAQEAAAEAGTEMTLDEVLDAHYEAIGGLDAIKAVDSARLTGTMTVGPGAEAPFTMVFKRPEKLRLEFTLQGMTGIQATDGETAWMIMPFMGKTDPEVMPADQAKQLAEQADFDGPLVDWKEKGHEVELLGKEEVEGTDAYELKVTMEGGDVRYHYLDSEYFVPIKMEGTTTAQGSEVEFEVTLSDYKEVDGLMLAHSIESKPKGAESGQVITIKEVELNPEVGDELFAMPEVPTVEEGGEAEDAG